MARNQKNMLETPTCSSLEYPLRLDFFQAGDFRREVKGWVHRKTVPYVILVQPVAGSYVVACRGKRETVQTGRVLIVPAYTPVEFTHRDGPGGEMAVRWLHLRYTYLGLGDFLARYDLPLQLPEAESRAVGRLIERALKTNGIAEGDPLRLIRQHEIGAQTLDVLCRNRRLNEHARLADARWRRLGEVLEHIRENLAAPITVAALAKRSGLSPARFYAVFKEEFGVTPMEHVRTLRLEAAARLLAATDSKLADIAGSVGLADAFHLSHAFKAHFGASPRDYRKSVSAVYS